MRSEFQDRLETTDKEIADVEAQRNSCVKAKESAIAAGDAARAVKSKYEAKTLEERLEDLSIKRLAIQAKLQTYERNHKAAAKIRDEISSTWQQVGPLVDVLIQAQRTVAQTLAKITPLQREIGALAARHIELTDESFDPPVLQLPRGIQFFPNLQLRPLDPWRYLSAEDKRAADAKRIAQEQETQATRVKVALANAPVCENCKQAMAITTSAHNRETDSGQWTFFCRTHHTVTKKYIEELDSSRGEKS